MNNNQKYTLVLEKMPNSFDPIVSHIWDNLKDIDDITTQYSQEDFRNLLLKNNYIQETDDINKLQIIFYNNGLRRVKEGILYKNSFNDNMPYYVIKFINIYKVSGAIINELYQYMNNKKTVSMECKIILRDIVSKRKGETEEYEMCSDLLNNVSYYDIRTMYLFITNVLLLKIENEIEDNADLYKLKRVNNN